MSVLLLFQNRLCVDLVFYFVSLFQILIVDLQSMFDSWRFAVVEAEVINVLGVYNCSLSCSNPPSVSATLSVSLVVVIRS